MTAPAFAGNIGDSGKGHADHVSVDAGAGYMLDALGIYDNLLEGKCFWQTGVAYGIRRVPSGDFYDWAYNYPEYGARLFYTSTGSLAFKNDSCLGDMLTLQGFFKPNLYRNDIFSFGPVLNLGLSYTSVTWDPENNLNNWYVGSRVLVNLGFGLEARVQCGRRVSLAFQAVMSHRSNGMLQVPNWGLNNAECGVQLRYHLDEAPVFRRGTRPEMPAFKKIACDVYVTGGVHSCDAERAIVKECTGEDIWAKRYARLGIGTLVSYRYHPLFATGAGADIFYTGNWKRLEYCSRLLGDPQKCSPVYAGLYINQSLYYKCLELGIGLGVYVFKRLGPEDSTWNYQRVHMRWHFVKTGLFTGVALRAHRFDRSDTIEITLGKRF